MWHDINQIISNIQKKGGLKKKFQNSLLKDFLEKKYRVNDFIWKNNKIEIKVKNTILAQELFLVREKIKKELNRLLKNDAAIKRYEDVSEIKEVIIKVGR